MFLPRIFNIPRTPETRKFGEIICCDGEIDPLDGNVALTLNI